MTISVPQIRAGRAMKNWNQTELAAYAGVAVPTIANIETRKQKASKRTLHKIQTALEKAGIEFIDNDGIRRKKEEIRVLRGRKQYIEYFDLIYEHANEKGGPIYLTSAEEKNYEQWHPNFFNSDYYHNMVRIRDKFDLKITLEEGDTCFPAKEYAEYRWIPKEEFSPISFEVFGDYLGIKLFFPDEPIIFLIKNKEAADLYREKFLLQWEKSISIPQLL